MADLDGGTTEGGFVPDGSTLLGVDDSGIAHIQGPMGGYVAYPADALHPNDQAKLGLTPPSAPVDAGAPAAIPSTGGAVSPGSDLGQQIQSMSATAQPDQPGLLSQAGHAVMDFAQQHPVIAGATISPMLGLAGAATPEKPPALDATKALPDNYQPPHVVQPGQGTGYQPTPAPPMKAAGAKDYSGEANAGFNAEGKAIQAEGEAEGASVGAKAGNAASAAQQQQQALVDAQQQRQAVVDQYKQRMAQIDKAQSELDAQKEDPNHWWNTRDTGQKIAATLSQAIAGFAAGFSGRDVHSPVDKFIEQDIEAQRQNYMRASSSLAAKRSAYAQLREQGLNDVEASLALKSQQYAAAQKSLDAMIDQKYAPDIVKQRAAQQSAQLQQKKASTDAQLQQAAATTAHERVATMGELQNITYQKQAMDMQRQMMSSGQLPPQLAGRAVFVHNPDGSMRAMLAPDEKSAAALKDQYSASESVLKDIAEAKQLAQQFGSSSAKTQVGAAYKAKLDGIITKLNHAQGINQAVDENQRKLYMETFGNTTTTPTAATLKGLEGLEQTLRGGVASAFASNGMQNPYAYLEQKQAANDSMQKKYGGQ